jgi:tetratricopeptide (TPR) repeat protein
VSLWQLQVARTERRRAEESKEFIASIFRSADPFYTGKDSMTAVDLLSLARQRIDRELATQPQNAVELLTLVGESQLNLQQDAAAKATLGKAIEMAEHLQPRDEVLLAEARARLAVVASENGDWTQVRALAAQTLPVLRQNQPRTGRMLYEMLISMGYAESDEGNPEAAIAFAREAVSAVTAALGPDHSESITSRYHLATFIQDAGGLAEARAVMEGVVRDARDLASSGEGIALVIQAEGRYGSVLIDLGETQTAISHLKAAVDLAAQLYGPRSPSRYTWLSELGRAQSRIGDFKGLLVTRQLGYEGQEPGLLQARSLTNFGRSTLAARKVPDSLERLRGAIELEEKYDTGKGSWLVLARSDYGAALALSGRFAEADRLLRETLPLAKETTKEGSLAAAWNAVGLTRQLQSQWVESEKAFREALANTVSTDSSQKLRAEALLGIGMARLELGQAADAENWLRQADEAARKTFQGMMPLRAEIAMSLGRALLAQGQHPAANESLAAANAYWLDYDATNRCAGHAAYWAARGHLATGAHQEAQAQFTRAIDILEASALPVDRRLVKDTRQTLARL